MIRIGKVEYRELDDRTVLDADISIPQEALVRWKSFAGESEKYNDFSYITSDYEDHVPTRLFFSVEPENSCFLRKDRADAFVTAMLYYAMATGEDIYSESPVSEELMFKLNHMWSKLISATSRVRAISVHAEPAGPGNQGSGFVGTGMSMGADSLHTLYEYGVLDVEDSYRLTHLTYFNVGADRWRLQKGRKLDSLMEDLEEASRIRNKRMAQARQIAEEMHMGFVYLDSNISEFYEGSHESSHLFRSCAAAMALSGGFSKYYFSSTGLDHFDYQPSLRVDAAHYEQFVLPCLSTPVLEIICGGKPFTRLDKLDRISEFPIAQQYLITCDQESTCYRCTKDFRTIIAIDILGRHKEYAKVFDPEKCAAVRRKAYGWLVLNRNSSEPAQLLWEKALEKGLIPFSAYPTALEIQIKRVVKKLLKRMKRG
jgi:hypothetical protein